MLFCYLEKSLAVNGQNRGFLSYSPEKCCKIIMATMVLHNICINHGLDTVIDTVDETIDDTITPHSSGNGVLMRQEILVSTFFD